MNREELYQQAVALHNEGYGSRRIVKILGVPTKKKLVDQWIYFGHKPNLHTY
jgi:hypothetical protein